MVIAQSSYRPADARAGVGTDCAAVFAAVADDSESGPHPHFSIFATFLTAFTRRRGGFSVAFQHVLPCASWARISTCVRGLRIDVAEGVRSIRPRTPCRARNFPGDDLAKQAVHRSSPPVGLDRVSPRATQFRPCAEMRTRSRMHRRHSGSARPRTYSPSVALRASPLPAGAARRARVCTVPSTLL